MVCSVLGPEGGNSHVNIFYKKTAKTKKKQQQNNITVFNIHVMFP